MVTKSKNILVLGSSREIMRTLFRGGYTPIVQDTMQGALQALDHDELTGILLDRTHAHVDPLELILNVRDIYEQIPVVVIGESSGNRKYEQLLSEHSTVVLDSSLSPSQLTEKLDRAFNMAFIMERSEYTGE